MNFYKYHGTGNDFIIVDNRKGEHSNLSSAQIKMLCHRRFGIGADGLMLLNTAEGYDFEMKYYNSDGAEGSMCGNGGRCIVKFAYDIGIRKNSYHFMAVDGEHTASFDENNWIKLKMNDVGNVENNEGYILNTGSPHFVKMMDSVAHYDVVKEGRKIRNSKPYERHGINVNFVEINDDHIFVRTYERGVEEETLSCGTGVAASALVCAHNSNGFNRVEVKTLGGNLAVEFEKHDDEHFNNILLCGPVEFVFEGTIDNNVLIS